LTAPPGTAGVIFRPRRGRVEACCEYLHDPDRLRAALVLLSAAVALDADDGSSLPRLPDGVLEPSPTRNGWALRRSAISATLDEEAIGALVELGDGRKLELGEFLGELWARLAPYVRDRVG